MMAFNAQRAMFRTIIPEQRHSGGRSKGTCLDLNFASISTDVSRQEKEGGGGVIQPRTCAPQHIS